MKYTIMAECKTYSEWSINDIGVPIMHEHDFEGVDVICYKIVDEDEGAIFEHKNFKIVKAKLLELQDFMPCGHNKQRCSKDVCIDDIPL